MTALPADVAPAMRQAIIVTQQDAAILSKFPTARDGLNAPATGYFDSAADAATALAARAALIGVVRRRFKAVAVALLPPDLSLGVPCFQLVDAEQSVNAAHLAARIEVDFEEETTGMELFG